MARRETWTVQAHVRILTIVSVMFILLGLVPHFVTVAAFTTFLLDGLRTRTYVRRTGLPLVGPILVTGGLLLLPSAFPLWLLLAPWTLEFGLAAAGRVVQRMTRSAPRGN